MCARWKDIKTTNMAALKIPETLKAAIWHHFGFRSNKENELDKSKAICKACQMEVKYCGNTTNLRNHMMRHHQDIISKPATGPQQMTLKQTLQLPTNSARSVKITEAIAGFICKDMRPYSVVVAADNRSLNGPSLCQSS